MSVVYPDRLSPPIATVLVTGGLGYIGSHTCVALMARGHHVVIVDDLSNSRREVVDAIADLAGRRPSLSIGDVRDPALLDRVITAHGVEAAIHFAGLKAVGDSVDEPLEYYDVNVGGSLSLLRALQRANAMRVVFSSSATVYGQPDITPVPESHPSRPASPYGRSKWMVEQMINDWCAAEPIAAAMILRYFNPAGAHVSGRLGESPRGTPNNLMPYLGQVANGERECLSVFGTDYPTHDGTGVRDYVHVMDLADAHVAALDRVLATSGPGTANIGTGVGYSVLDLLHAYERACGHALPWKATPRRAGDVPEYFADPARAAALLGWTATRDIDAMCADDHRYRAMRGGRLAHAAPSFATTDEGIRRLAE